MTKVKETLNLKCPECGNEDDFTLTGEGIFSIRKRIGYADEIEILTHTDEVESCSCNKCEYTGEYIRFRPDMLKEETTNG